MMFVSALTHSVTSTFKNGKVVTTLNEPVNLNLCTQFSRVWRGASGDELDEMLPWAIRFRGADVEWRYADQASRDADFTAISAMVCR